MKVIGIGGGGCNTLNHLIKTKNIKAEFIALNTEWRGLERSKAGQKLLLGPKLLNGFGAGGNPALGQKAALESAEALRDLCKGGDFICLLAGLGAGTGTGAAPEVARIAQETGAFVVTIVTLPFEHEGPIRQAQAVQGLEAIKNHSDVVLKFPNEKINRLCRQANLNLPVAFGLLDGHVSLLVRAFGDLFFEQQTVSADVEEWQAHLGPFKGLWFGTATVEGKDRFTQAIDEVVRESLIEEVKFRRVNRLFFMVVCKGITLGEFNVLVGSVRDKAPQGCILKVGLADDPAMKKDELRLSVWATAASNKM
jgi:cell division protein FtsZ